LALPATRETLGEHAAKRCLAAYGIPVVNEVLIPSEAVVETTDLPLHFPLAVKVESPDIPHKTEAGAVKLGIADLASLKRAAQDVIEAARRFNPDARIEGVVAAEMQTGLE